MKAAQNLFQLLPVYLALIFMASCVSDDGPIATPERPDAKEPSAKELRIERTANGSKYKTYMLSAVDRPNTSVKANLQTLGNKATAAKLNVKNTAVG